MNEYQWCVAKTIAIIEETCLGGASVFWPRWWVEPVSDMLKTQINRFVFLKLNRMSVLTVECEAQNNRFQIGFYDPGAIAASVSNAIYGSNITRKKKVWHMPDIWLSAGLNLNASALESGSAAALPASVTWTLIKKTCNHKWMLLKLTKSAATDGCYFETWGHRCNMLHGVYIVK